MIKQQQGNGKHFWYIIYSLITLIVLGLFIQVLLEPKKSRIDEWFDGYSLSECEENVKSRLRDPDSYKRIQMLLPTKVSNDEKILRWDFRARNGFGGYNLSTAECIVMKKGNGIISTNTKDLN